jgi:hypothetical protein
MQMAADTRSNFGIGNEERHPGHPYHWVFRFENINQIQRRAEMFADEKRLIDGAE